MDREFKSLVIENKQVEGQDRTFDGFAAVIGNVDDGNDRILSGAFLKSIEDDFDRVKHLWQHDFRSPPVAHIEELREVGLDEIPDKIKVKGGTGALLVRRTYLDTERGNEVLKGIVSGAVNEMSFAFNVKEYEIVEEEDRYGELFQVRNIKRLQLWDTSDVVWGMNPLTIASKESIFGALLQDVPEDRVSELMEKMRDLLEEFLTESSSEKRTVSKQRIEKRLEIAKRRFKERFHA